MVEVLWLGRGGQGAFTAARLLGLSAVRFGGLQALAFPSFGPERRGAPVSAFTKIDARPIRDRSVVRRADAVVLMDGALAGQPVLEAIGPDTLVVADDAVPLAVPLGGRVFRVPAAPIAAEILQGPHTNTVLLGFLIGLGGYLAPEAVEAGIDEEFTSPQARDRNRLAFRTAYEAGKALAP